MITKSLYKRQWLWVGLTNGLQYLTHVDYQVDTPPLEVEILEKIPGLYNRFGRERQLGVMSAHHNQASTLLQFKGEGDGKYVVFNTNPLSITNLDDVWEQSELQYTLSANAIDNDYVIKTLRIVGSSVGMVVADGESIVSGNLLHPVTGEPFFWDPDFLDINWDVVKADRASVDNRTGEFRISAFFDTNYDDEDAIGSPIGNVIAVTIAEDSSGTGDCCPDDVKDETIQTLNSLLRAHLVCKIIATKNESPVLTTQAQIQYLMGKQEETGIDVNELMLWAQGKNLAGSLLNNATDEANPKTGENIKNNFI